MNPLEFLVLDEYQRQTSIERELRDARATRSQPIRSMALPRTLRLAAALGAWIAALVALR